MAFPFLAAAAFAGQQGLSAWNSSNNIGMQRETNSMNYEMWQKQLDYDRPVNQVARLKEAGLNPALMYGTGSGANVAPKPIAAEAPKGSYNLDPGAVVALQQARLLGEQRRGLQLENDQNDPKIPRSSTDPRKGDSGPVRAAKDIYSTLKDTGGDFVRGLKSYGNEFMNRHGVTFGDSRRKQGLFYGPKPQGYTHPLMRGRKQ